jgi:hypothetical protein
MKKLLLIATMLFTFGAVNAQTELDLTNKTFLNEDDYNGTSRELFFNSKNQVTYIITTEINGKTYIDKCPGKATISGNEISIIYNCADKEIYPDPIKESFVYDSKTKTFKSTSYRFVWRLK